jgi:hypothetical protein
MCLWVAGYPKRRAAMSAPGSLADDTGIAGVDIYRMDAEGKAVEHWDTLQLVGTPQNSAPIIAPNIPRANANGMF